MMILRLAGVTVGIDNQYDFSDRVRLWLADGAPDFTVRVAPEELEREDEGRGLPREYLEFVCAYRHIAERMPDYDAFVFHGAAVVVDDLAYLITAPSGTGKTTLTRFWRYGLDCGAWVLNGDKPILRRDPGGFTVCGTPWRGKEGHGINAERFRFDPKMREAVRRELGLTDKFVVGHVGRFYKQKNHAFLIRIFEKVHEIEPESVLLLFGKGDLEPEIRDLVKACGLTSCVRFMGEVTDIERMYQAMDVFVMPSFHEGLPVSCVEIQTAGVPCVLSDTITEEIRIEESMLFLGLSQSPEEWADAVLSKKGCRDLDGYENVIRSGYAIRDVADGMLKMYKELYKGSQVL